VHEVSESPEEWQGDYVEDDPLPTVHRRVMLTDLPASGLEEIARRLKLTLPDPEPELALTPPEPASEPEPGPELRPELRLEREPAPEPELEHVPEPAAEHVPQPVRVPEQVPAPEVEQAPERVPEPARDLTPASAIALGPGPAQVTVDRGPVLAALPVAELEELAREQFTRVVHGPAEVPATDELYEHLRGAGLQRIDAFAYRVEDGRPVVVVRPSSAPEGARTLHRVVRTPEAVWQVVDVWIGVPISMVRNPPTDLLEAAYYAVH